jgi:two-component sensor histidine kinase
VLRIPERIASRVAVAPEQSEFLEALTEDWHLLADLSFSDLILWVPGVDDNEFYAIAQIRPATGPTALDDDVVGEVIAYDYEHLVTEAYLSREICETSDNRLQAGIPVDVWAIPLIVGDECVGVVERHTNQMGVRAPGELEDHYLAVADTLADMAWRGVFPDPGHRHLTGSPMRVGEGFLLVSADEIIEYASPNAVSAYRKLGLTGDLIGEPIIPLTLRLLNGSGEPVDRSLAATFRSSVSEQIELETDRASLTMRTLPLTSAEGRIGTVAVCRDTTELRRKERQLITKDATIREIHHRVKNNLQTVSALLRLQARRVESPEAAAALGEAVARVQSIAVVHEILSRSLTGMVQFDDVADRLLKLAGDLAASHGSVHATRDGEFGEIPAAVATSLSLVLTELCQNAIEHGLSEGSGRLVVSPRRLDDGSLRVSVVDEGQGLPENFQLCDQGRTSLGLSIVTTLIDDLGGDFTLTANPSGVGAQAVVTIPLTTQSR